MANPFLFEDVADYSEATSFNPFLCGGDEPVVDENPFLTSVSSAPGTNPFADYSWDEPAGNNPGLLTPPAITNINDPENDFIVSSDDEASKPRRPPPPRPSMAKETHDLILSVTGALKATSDDLLERIPPTRAPSPTVFADLHSPSPVPDLMGGEDNLLGLATAAAAVAQPPRPPPPRPPTRPAPPAVPPAPKVEAFAPQPEIDLFGTPSAPQPKSTDAILNLYSQPKPPQDLMSDDLTLETPLFSAPLQSEIPETVVSEVQEPSDRSPAEPVEVEKIHEPVQEEVSIFGTGPPQQQSAPEVAAFTAPEDIPEVASTEEAPVQESPSIFGTTEVAPEEPKPVPVASQVFAVTPPEERPPPPPPPAKDTPRNKPLSFVPSVADVYAHVVAQDSIDYSGDDPIDPYGVATDVQESAPQIFGVGPPPQEPQIFGVSAPPVAQEPQIFGVPAQLPPQEPQIFGVSAPPPVQQPEIPAQEQAHQIFGVGPPEPVPSIFGTGYTQPEAAPNIFGVPPAAAPVELEETDTFDAFSAKFDEVKSKSNDPFDAFGGDSSNRPKMADAWGSGFGSQSIDQGGFGVDNFDEFLSMTRPPVPPPPVRLMGRSESAESEDGGFNVVIKPREGDQQYIQPTLDGHMPVLAPPPKSPGYAEGDPKFNPFDQNGQIPALPLQTDGYALPPLSQAEPYEGGFKRTDSQETPTTPLFDEDVSQPLEEFPRIHYVGDGWEMQLRHPNKKKITGQRFWKKIFVKLVYQGDNPVLQLFNLKEDKDPFQELPLQACYSVSEISAQQYDQFGKIFTVKLQYIFYKERPGVRPGQVTKAERITTKLSQFAAYAIQGDYQGVKEFGSDLKKLGLPVEHAPQVSQLLKLGCMAYEDLKQFSVTIEECLFRMPVHRDRALTYKMEEVQITVVDEISVEQDAYGHVEKQIARVRLFFLAFLSGMPDVELGVNDMWRQGKEVVGRHDIIPVATEEWIRLEGVEFHSCIQLDEYEKTRTIKFKPPDACYIELMRFRIRPPRNRELPLQLKAVMCVTGNKVELRADVLVPGFTSRKLGQIPCEDVMIRFPIPECWIYLFRVEKHFRYGSVKSAHRRTGKVKGIERFLGAVDNLEPHLLEVTSGQAKYEHPHRAIVWRMPRLPKEGQGAYTTHNLVCRMQLASYDQIPDNLAEYAYVEFTMPATTASHTTVRSVSLVDSPSDDPPEKYVRQLARMEYRVGIEHTQGEEMASYIAATAKTAAPKPQETTTPLPAPDSDSESSG